jgi:hypothetical protein
MRVQMKIVKAFLNIEYIQLATKGMKIAKQVQSIQG